MNQVDTIIFGVGLSGFCSAKRLSLSQQNILLIDKADRMGGPIQFENRDGFLLEKCPLFFNTPDSFFLIANKLNINIPFFERDEIPVTFEGGQFQPSNENQKTYIPERGFENFIESFSGSQQADAIDIQLNYPLFQIHIENNQIKGITLENGEKIDCRSLIWADRSWQILNYIDQANLPKDFLFLLNEKNSMPHLKLDFALEIPVTDIEDPITIAMAKNDNKKGKLTGFFPSNRNKFYAPSGRQLSSWITPLLDDEIDDNQKIAKKIRHIKRLILKPFPKFFDRVLWEKISIVDSQFLSKKIKLNSNLKTKTPIAGLYLAGESISPILDEFKFSNSHSWCDREIQSGMDAAEALLRDLS